MRWLAFLLIIFAPLLSQTADDDDQLYLSLNINDGERLELSDGSTYEIAPIDRIYSAYWITPFPIMLSESGDQEYPVKITNMNSGTFVRGKQLETREVIEEERQKRLEQEKMRKTQPQQKGKQPLNDPSKGVPNDQQKPSPPSSQQGIESQQQKPTSPPSQHGDERQPNAKFKPSPTKAFFRQEQINQ